MAIHDYNISNQTFPLTRTDINSVLGAILSSNSNSAAPVLPGFTTVAGMLWYDTSTNLLKVYNGTSYTDIKAGQVATTDLGPLCVTTAKIASNAVNADKLNVSGNGTATQFLRSDADGSFTWATPTDNDTTYSAGTGIKAAALTGGTPIISLLSDLRVGISHIGIDNNDHVAINATTIDMVLDGATQAQVKSDGDLHVLGSIVAYYTAPSDERLKTAISTVEDALTKVSQLNGVEFTRKNSGERSAGVIAQDVEKVLPQAVTDRALPLHTGTEEVFKTVEYDALHSLYIEAIKELKDMVEKQAVQIKELQGT
jgi:hypothetical protein